MDNSFRELIDGLHGKYLELVSMQPVTIDTTPDNCPVGGVYLFTENGKHLYAGRTKRKISVRLKGHVNTSKDLTCSPKTVPPKVRFLWDNHTLRGGLYHEEFKVHAGAGSLRHAAG